MENQENIIIILAAIAAVSEALSLIPSIKSNGILQGIFSVIKKLVKK